MLVPLFNPGLIIFHCCDADLMHIQLPARTPLIAVALLYFLPLKPKFLGKVYLDFALILLYLLREFWLQRSLGLRSEGLVEELGFSSSIAADSGLFERRFRIFFVYT